MAGHHLANPAKEGVLEGSSRAYYSPASVAAHLKNADQRFCSQVYARHTAEQAEWVVDQVLENNINAIVLMAAVGHLFPRAFLTQLMAFEKRGLRIPMIPMPCAINPFSVLVPRWHNDSAWNEVSAHSQTVFHLGEHQRALDYSVKSPPDVATYKLLEDYGLWLAEHEMFKT